MAYIQISVVVSLEGKCEIDFVFQEGFFNIQSKGIAGGVDSVAVPRAILPVIAVSVYGNIITDWEPEVLIKEHFQSFFCFIIKCVITWTPCVCDFREEDIHFRIIVVSIVFQIYCFFSGLTRLKPFCKICKCRIISHIFYGKADINIVSFPQVSGGLLHRECQSVVCFCFRKRSSEVNHCLPVHGFIIVGFQCGGKPFGRRCITKEPEYALCHFLYHDLIPEWVDVCSNVADASCRKKGKQQGKYEGFTHDLHLLFS